MKQISGIEKARGKITRAESSVLDQQLKNGKQLTSVELGSENPWLAMAGMHDPNDPLIQEWKEEMAELVNRRLRVFAWHHAPAERVLSGMPRSSSSSAPVSGKSRR